MAVYITAVTDPFGELSGAGRPETQNVRRPLRGLQIKRDSYAVLRVMRADGTNIPLLDSSSSDVDDAGRGSSQEFSNFIVQSFQDQRMEKQQIVQTFGEDYIFFFGEQPRFVNVSGILVNTKNFDWKNEFLENYERYLRGTRLVENNARLYMYVDDVVLEGYLVNSSVNMSADQPYLVQFQFQMFVCQYATLTNTGSVYFQEYVTPEMQTQRSKLGAGVAPDTGAAAAAAAKNAAKVGSPGGLNGFLAEARKFVRDARSTVQQVLEEFRNTLYGYNIVAPDGLGSSIRPLPIKNEGSFELPPVNVPIHEQYDEYPERSDPPYPSFDKTEIERVNAELALQTPEQLEARARKQFAAAGIDTTRREATYLLLGRGAFAAFQTMGTFGARQADGTLNTASLAGDIAGDVLP